MLLAFSNYVLNRPNLPEQQADSRSKGLLFPEMICIHVSGSLFPDFSTAFFFLQTGSLAKLSDFWYHKSRRKNL